ncbi:MAG: ComEC/Rec2 family competence protein, partial [Aestuariivirgaceae bacterium]
AMPAGLAAFAEALITGNRAQIKPRLREQLSIAGLAHVLAISGLHMTLVAGGIFWLVRSLLALSPAMALHLPIKKLAAIAALIAAAGYLLISGGAVSTQRAFIMLSVMFIAILFDRPAISLRNLAIAATVIVVSAPESVLSAGFQMSFMAVMGLIATYEALRERRSRQPKKAYSRALPQRIWRWITSRVLAIALTTLIASLFTGLPAAYHFNRVAPLGVIANLLALPVVSLLVMPMAVLATVLMPLGLEGWPLWLMGQGLHWVTGVAHWVTGLPGASFAAATLPAISAVCFGFAAVWLCLWTGRLRSLAAAPAAVGLLMSVNVDRPDILIERTGKNVAYRGAEGRLLLADARKAKYTARKWLLRDGDGAELADAVKRQGWRCGNDKCVAATAAHTIVYLQEGAIIPDGCFEANIVISQFPLRGACRNVPVRIDRFDLWRSGSHAIYFAAGGAKIVTTAGTRGQRPWTITPVARRKIRLDPYAQN